MTVRDTDKGYQKLVSKIFTFGAPKIRVGILAQDGAQPHEGAEGFRVIDIAQIHEFGLGNVPQRSFIRAWFDENQDRARGAIRRLLQSVVRGDRTAEQAVELFAQWVVGQMQKRMAQGIPPALSARTIKRKGSSVPLIDTGQLRSSISYQILDENFALKKEGQSKASIQRAKTSLRDKKIAERKAAKARERQVKALKKAVTKGAKNLRRGVLRKVKQATKATKKVVRKITKTRR